MTQAVRVKVATTRFGEIEVDEAQVIDFPQGLVGLPQLRRFVLIDGKGPFKWMQSLDDPDATFVVIDSDEVVSEYEMHPSSEDMAVIVAPEEAASLSALLIVTVPRDRPESMTANLMAPVIVNQDRRLAVQAVLPDRYPVRYPIMTEKIVQEEAVPAG